METSYTVNGISFDDEEEKSPRANNVGPWTLEKVKTSMSNFKTLKEWKNTPEGKSGYHWLWRTVSSKTDTKEQRKTTLIELIKNLAPHFETDRHGGFAFRSDNLGGLSKMKWDLNKVKEVLKKFRTKQEAQNDIGYEYSGSAAMAWLKRYSIKLYGKSDLNRITKEVAPHFVKSYSEGETEIRDFLHKNDIEYYDQYTHKDCVGIMGSVRYKTCYPLRFDFYLPKLKTFVEFDGLQHFNLKGWRGVEDSQRYLNQIYNDITKNEFSKREGIKIIRISYNDFKNLEDEITQGLNSKEQLYLSTNYPKDMGWRDEELASVAREDVKDLFENINRINSLII